MRHAPKVRANAWEDVSDLSAGHGLHLDPWQEEVLKAGLGERRDGSWSVRQIGVSAPRQQGKSMLIVSRILAGLLIFDEQVIIVSAHRQDTAREVFLRLVQIIEDNPSLEDRVDFIARSEMREYIRMKSGQAVRFKARSGKAGRGFSCDCLLLDEAQSLSSESWAAILPTMSARPNPQVWLFGTPPTESDEGDVFRRFREKGIEGRESGIAYLEWSAEKGDDLDAVETWARANPAYGTRIDYESVAAERASLTDEQFMMERLGMWADVVEDAEAAVPFDSWASDSATISPDDVDPDWRLAAIGLDMDLTGRVWVAAAVHADGQDVHVELDEDDVLAAGVDAAVERVWRVCRKRLPVVLPFDSGARMLEAPLKAKGAMVYPLNTNEQAQAAQGLVQSLKDGVLTHLDDPVLAQAVRESGKTVMEGGRWRLARKGELSAAPLLAAACARHGAIRWTRRVNPDPNRQSGRSSAGRSSGRRAAARR